jgi:MFS family permease
VIEIQWAGQTCWVSTYTVSRFACGRLSLVQLTFAGVPTGRSSKSSRISFICILLQNTQNHNVFIPIQPQIATLLHRFNHVSIWGVLFGLDTGTIGPVTAMSTFAATFGQLSPMKHASIVSAILLPAAFAGLFAGNIADSYGRSTTIIVGGTIFGFGAILEAAAPKLAVFMLGRVTKGLGEGLFLATVTTYICEISPARRRGPLASIAQFAVTIGIAAGYFISFGTSKLGSTSVSWRLLIAFQVLVAFSMVAACLKIPPSPRWLISKGRSAEAQVTLGRLSLASSEIEEMIRQTAEETTDILEGGLLWNVKARSNDFANVFSKDARKQTSLSCFMMIMQQFSGIDGVLFYAPTLFQKMDLASEQASFLASGVSALAMFAVTIPASIFCDYWGRRVSACGWRFLSFYLYAVDWFALRS